MEKAYYTYYIRVANRDCVLVEKRDARCQDLGRPSRPFGYREKLQQMEPLLKMARDNSLNDADKARELGETLFDVLFDDVLCQDFVNFYERVVQKENKLLRVELDVDERGMPEVAALPWEFLRVPTRANLGSIWMATLPNLIFSRRRSQWNPAKPIQLKPDEKLKIALVVSAPSDLKPVAYEPVQKALEELARERVNRIELLPTVCSANPEEIDKILSKQPHIFHFIGHGRLVKKGDREVGEIALVVPDFDEAMWVDADYFSGLFGRHRPSVVMLQACEGGKLSDSQAFVGVASGIVWQNIPVVVAMQYEVTNSTASQFARRFYQKLAEYKPVDIAAQEGRYAIALGPTQYRKRDFATPVIFMGVENGYLFRSQETGRLTDLPGISKGKQENSPGLNLSAIPPESIQQAYQKALPLDANLWDDLEENGISQVLEIRKQYRRTETGQKKSNISDDKKLALYPQKLEESNLTQYEEFKLSNASLTLYAFHLRHSISDRVVPEASDLWDKLAEFGDILKIEELQNIRQKLICYEDKQYYPKAEDQQETERLTLLRDGKNELRFSIFSELKGMLCPFRLHDTYGIDFTVSSKETVTLKQLKSLNPEYLLLPSKIPASLGQTLFFWSELLEDEGDYRGLANACVAQLIPESEHNFIDLIAKGSFLGNPIFEYESTHKSQAKRLHILVCFERETIALEPIDKLLEIIFYVLWLRHKILYVYEQSRLCAKDARLLCAEIEEFGRNKNFPDFLEMQNMEFQYAEYIRNLRDYQTTIKVNEENYLIQREKIAAFPESDFDFLDKFFSPVRDKFKKQIEVDLDYLERGKERLQQLLGIVRASRS